MATFPPALLLNNGTGLPALGGQNPLPTDGLAILQALLGAPPQDAAPAAAPPPIKPPPYRLSREKRDQLLQQVQEHYEETLSDMDTLAQRRDENYRRYLADKGLRAGMQPWEDAPLMFMPETQRAIQKMLEELLEMFDDENNISIAGIGEEDRLDADKATQFWWWKNRNVIPYRQTLIWLFQDATVDEFGVLKVFPYRQPFDHPDTEPPPQFLEVISKMEAVDPSTLHIPADATGLQYPEARFLHQDLWLTPEEMDALGKQGYTLPSDDDIQYEGSGDVDQAKETEFSRSGLHPETYYQGKLHMVESYEVFEGDFLIVNWFPVLRKLGDGQSTAALGRAVLLRDVIPQHVFARPTWPYFPIVLDPQRRQLRGLSMAQRLAPYQDLLNRLTEQMVHQGAVDILPYVFANIALTGELPDLTQIRPGEVIPIDQMGQVFFKPPTSSNRHYLEQIQYMKGEIEQALPAANAFTQGRAPDRPNAPRTATGLLSVIQEGKKAVRAQLGNIIPPLRDAFRLDFAIWQQRLSGTGVAITAPGQPQQAGDIYQRLFGGGSQQGPQRQVQITRDDLAGLYDLNFRLNPDGVLEQQKIVQAGQLLLNVLQPIWPLGARRLLKRMWEGLKLQGFDELYPEEVAIVETMLLFLKVQQQLGPMADGGILGLLGGAGAGGGGVPGQPQPALPPGQSPAGQQPGVGAGGNLGQMIQAQLGRIGGGIRGGVQ